MRSMILVVLFPKLISVFKRVHTMFVHMTITMSMQWLQSLTVLAWPVLLMAMASPAPGFHLLP